MTKDSKDNLFSLVKSMTKSEKRQFKLYVGRLDGNENAKFLQLFVVLDKLTTYDEVFILKHINITKRQLPNVKSHLYKQILISLRLNPLHKTVKTQIREQLDYAGILYHKGLYNQALKILDKTKSYAIEHHEKNLAYEIVEFEKLIEAQYITRSIQGRADELTIQAKNLSRANVITSKLSNLSLQLYGLYLKIGCAKNEDEEKEIKQYFKARLPKYKINELGFREKLWLYRSFLWKSLLLQNFLNSYKYALKWVSLYQDDYKLINLNPVFFVKGTNYLLDSLFYLRDKERFKYHLEKFENQVKHPSFNTDENLESLLFLYVNINKINFFFIDGSFQEGVELIPSIEPNIAKYDSRIDNHHKMVFYYKFACLHFGAGNYKVCIEYLDKIISDKTLTMREDLQCFSRVLNVVAHYEAGIDESLENLLRSTYKFIIKMDELYEVQKEFLKFIRGLQNIYPQDLKKAFATFHNRLKIYENHPFEKRAFLYLDILSWLESNIQNRPVSDIILEKFKTK